MMYSFKQSAEQGYTQAIKLVSILMINIMHTELEQFFLRNMGDDIKHSDVSDELIQKYTGILPEPILEVWRRTGFGIYEHGFIQFVDPEEWDFVFE